MKRKAKELQAARVSAGKGRSYLPGFGGASTSGGSVRSDITPVIGDSAAPQETKPSYSARWITRFFHKQHFYKQCQAEIGKKLSKN